MPLGFGCILLSRPPKSLSYLSRMCLTGKCLKFRLDCIYSSLDLNGQTLSPGRRGLNQNPPCAKNSLADSVRVLIAELLMCGLRIVHIYIFALSHSFMLFSISVGNKGFVVAQLFMVSVHRFAICIDTFSFVCVGSCAISRDRT